MRMLTSWLQIIPAIALLCASPVDAELVTVGGEFQVNTTTFTDEEESSVAVGPDGAIVVVWEGTPHPGPPVPVATWELNGVINSANSVPVTNTAADVSGSDLAKSVTLGSSNFANAFVATGWPTTPGIDTDRYFEFSVTADVGLDILYSTVEFSLYNNFGGSSDWEIRSSDDGFAAALDSGTAIGLVGSGVSIVADVSSLGRACCMLTTFRFYSYNNTGTAPPDRRGFRGSAAGGDDLKVFGTVFVNSNEVVGQYYDATGTAVGGEFQVNTYIPDSQDEPAVAKDGEGNYVVVWETWGQCNDGIDFNNSIAGQRYKATGVPLDDEFLVSPCPIAGGTNPEVAADAAGNFVVTYLRGGEAGIFAQLYDSAGVKAGAEFPVSEGDVTSPAIASDPLGNFVIVWSDSSGLDGDGYGVFGRLYDGAGNAAGAAFQVNTFTVGDQSTSSGGAVDFDDAGNFVVVWDSVQDGDQEGVYGQYFDAGGSPVGPEFRVNTTTIGRQDSPAVARDGPGNTLIVWDGNGVGDDNGTFGQFYDTTGAAVGGEFRLNSTTLEPQIEPDVSANASGEFVVTWESRDTDWGDVHGQRLEVNAVNPVPSSSPIAKLMMAVLTLLVGTGWLRREQRERGPVTGLP